MKIALDKSDSNILKKNETYTLIDNTTLNDLVISKTILHTEKSTNGHTHKGQEEVYQFVSGHGTMTVGKFFHVVGAGDIVVIPDGYFHKVSNLSTEEDLIFVCVFNGKRNH
tara:strand:+ start:18 stop:350 length:333 start_codon:yes stop_codon:yes gene_type:complete